MCSETSKDHTTCVCVAPVEVPLDDDDEVLDESEDDIDPCGDSDSESEDDSDDDAGSLQEFIVGDDEVTDVECSDADEGEFEDMSDEESTMKTDTCAGIVVVQKCQYYATNYITVISDRLSSL